MVATISYLSRAGLAAAVMSLIAGCTKTEIRSIVGPRGQPTLFVSCGNAGECYQIAGRYCPQGYDIEPARTALDSVLITCRRADYAAPSYPAAPSVAAATYPPTAPARQEWRPVEPPSWQAGYAPPPPPPPPATADASGNGQDTTTPLVLPRPIGSREADIGY